MTPSAFTISGFGDEIASDPVEQLETLVLLGIHHLDLRAAWECNVLDLDAEAVLKLQTLLDQYGVKVAMIASPIGKSTLSEPPSFEAGRLETAIRLAEAFGTRLIRLFSFYHEGIPHADCRDAVIARVAGWARTAEAAGVTLLLENEGGLWADRPERCLDLLSSVNSPALRLTLDAGNFASLGVASRDEAYPLLRQWVRHLQIKDVVTATRAVVPAGQGDGQLSQLLAAARQDGYQGYLSLEPHLAVAGKAGGFSGPALFGEAARALRSILGDLETENQA
ncbi:MAG: sugar phosphate isomerase/epimerase family protein [Chloroflexota bacterium]